MKTLRISSAMLAILLFASAATPVVAMDENNRPSFFENAKGKVKDFSAAAKGKASDAFGKVKSGLNTGFDKVKSFAPFGFESDEQRDAFENELRQNVDNVDYAGKLGTVRLFMATQLANLRLALNDHSNIANGAVVAAVAAGAAYGVYKLCKYFKKRYVSGEFDVVRVVAENIIEVKKAGALNAQEAAASFNEAVQKAEIKKSLTKLAKADEATAEALETAMAEFVVTLFAETSDVNAAYKKLVASVSKANAVLKAQAEKLAAPAA